MATGVVKTFNENKGYGFITPENGGKDVHVRTAAILAGSAPEMKEGARVEYTPGEGPKGPLATDVRVIHASDCADTAGDPVVGSCCEISKTAAETPEAIKSPKASQGTCC